MNKLIILIFGATIYSQIDITTKEFNFYKKKNINEVNILEFINQDNGTFKVEVLKVNSSSHEKVKKSLIVLCELEFNISSGLSKNKIEYKECKNKIESNNYLLINKKNPNINFSHNYKFLEGEIIFRISGNFSTDSNKSKLYNGLLREWFEKNDQLYLEFNMKDGIKNGKCSKWYENGQIKSTYFYNMGKLEGTQKKWYPNGQMQATWNYKNDELNGLSTEWFENGEIKSIKKYQNGKFIETL